MQVCLRPSWKANSSHALRVLSREVLSREVIHLSQNNGGDLRDGV